MSRAEVEQNHLRISIVDHDDLIVGPPAEASARAFAEHNMLVYEGNVVAYTSDIADWSVVQGFNGATWYHYFGRTGKSFFTTLGLGVYYFKVEDFDTNDPGGALLFGGGYEFAKHRQFGLSVAAGRTKSSGVDFDHVHISLLISGIAFLPFATTNRAREYIPAIGGRRRSKTNRQTERQTAARDFQVADLPREVVGLQDRGQ